MGTRSVIGVMEDGICRAVYCHWDGYLSHNGKILQEHYNKEKVEQLISLGNLSSLGAHIGQKHDINNYKLARDNNWCSFYGRDANEDNQEALTFAGSEKVLFDNFPYCDYYYILKDGRWYVSRGNDHTWDLLEKLLLEDDA